MTALLAMSADDLRRLVEESVESALGRYAPHRPEPEPIRPVNAKEAVLREALEAGAVQLRINATRPGVKLPPEFLGEPELRLDVGWRMSPPMDLEVGPEGVQATLSFRGVRAPCFIPWRAVACIGTVLFLDDIHPRTSHLRVVPGGDA